MWKSESRQVSKTAEGRLSILSSSGSDWGSEGLSPSTVHLACFPVLGPLVSGS